MRILIVYATKYGCTEKAARMLREKLEGEVIVVNIMKEKLTSLKNFDTIILGGSIYVGKIQKQLTSFINDNLPTLMNKRVGLFICAGSPDLNARIKELETCFPSDLYNHAVCKELFGSEIIFDKLGFLDKQIMRAVKGDKEDFADLSEEKISLFAKAIS